MIQRVLTLLVLLSLQLFARQYDNTLLDIEAKLFPKIAMLEKNTKNISSPNLSIAIISQEIDLDIAHKLKSRILKNYPDKILNKKIVIEIRNSKDILTKEIDAIIILHHPKEVLLSIASWANRRNVLSFAYDAADLDYNILASIYIGKTTKPYLNTKIIKKYGFTFDPYLLQLSKLKK